MNNVIDLGDFPVNPSITQVNYALQKVSAHLGGDWTVKRVRSVWVISRDGTRMGKRRSTRFCVALADATGCAIVGAEPFVS